MNAVIVPLFASDPRRCTAGHMATPKNPVGQYPHGRYCVDHARMMAPRSQWLALGIPYPPGGEPQPLPVQTVLDGLVRACLGFAYWIRIGKHDVRRDVEPVWVTYTPCPQGCGRPSCVLDGQPPEPCLTCQMRSHGTAAELLAATGE